MCLCVRTSFPLPYVCVCLFLKKKKHHFFFTNNHSPYQQFLKFFVQKFVSLALFKVEEFLLQKKNIKISQNNYENLRKLGNFLLLNLVQVGDLSPNEILTFIGKKIV